MVPCLNSFYRGGGTFWNLGGGLLNFDQGTLWREAKWDHSYYKKKHMLCLSLSLWFHQQIISVKELQTCQYEVEVFTPLLCANAAYKWVVCNEELFIYEEMVTQNSCNWTTDWSNFSANDPRSSIVSIRCSNFKYSFHVINIITHWFISAGPHACALVVNWTVHITLVVNCWSLLANFVASIFFFCCCCCLNEVPIGLHWYIIWLLNLEFLLIAVFQGTTRNQCITSAVTH